MPSVYQLVAGAIDAAGNYVENVYHFLLAEAGAGTPYEYANALITAWVAGPGATLLGCLGSDYLLNNVTARKVTNGGGPTAVQNPNQNGSWASLTNASGLSVNMSWIPGAGANRPGHTFVPGIPASEITGSTISPGLITALGLWAAAQIASFNLTISFGDAQMVIFHRKTSLYTIIADYVVRPVLTFFNQRKRPIT